MSTCTGETGLHPVHGNQEREPSRPPGPAAYTQAGAGVRGTYFSGSCPQFISEYRHGVSVTSPAGRCPVCLCT